MKDLFALLQQGALTQAEYDQQKAALLAITSGPPPGLSGPPPAGSDPSIPSQVGAYKIIAPIGQGGMGAVYRGRHRSDTIAERQGGDVAIKVMHAQYARNPDFISRFEREASLGLKLDHPGIVKVHDLVVDAGTLALVMELVEGRSLADLIGKEVGPIPWPRAWPMFEQLLDAVEYAHDQGVIHRDLKPENVMVTPDGRLKILDFGIAKEAGGSGMTATGSGMGTVDYMAPEQHTDAKNVDERADVYALGMTLYEMLAGRLPWGDEVDAVGVLHRKLSGAIPPPTDFYPDIPPEVTQSVTQALLPTPARRPRTPGKLRKALGQPVHRTTPASVAQEQPDPGDTPRPGDHGSHGGIDQRADAPPLGVEGRGRPLGPEPGTPGPRRLRLFLGLGALVLTVVVIAGIAGVALIAASGWEGEDERAVQSEPSPAVREASVGQQFPPPKVAAEVQQPGWPNGYGWTPYTNGRFGFQVEVPDFFVPGPDPVNLDGKRFTYVLLPHADHPRAA